MVNAVVPLGEKPNTYGWLQLEKKAAQELQKLIQASPTAASTLMYMVNHMSRSNALVVSQAAIAKGIGAKREREPRCPLPGRTQLHPGHQSRRCIGLCGEQPGHVARQPGNVMQPSGLTSWPSSEQDPATIEQATPLKCVPRLIEGERLLVGNEQIDPPDQGELELP